MGPNLAASDTPADWHNLAKTLGDPSTPFPDWGRLLHLVVRLSDPSARNPMGELATFLAQEKFELDPRGFSLLIPRRLRGVEPVVPAGSLVVTVTPRTGPPIARALKQTAESERAGDDTIYHFAAEAGPIAYQPGDALRVELPVKSGNEELKLIWDNSRSRTYQFDVAAREPRLLKGTVSEPAPNVKLTPSSESTWPRIPSLFPAMGK